MQRFYGWWVVFACFLTFGLSTGLPYYNMPFFYDYYEKNFGWSRSDITLGFPVAALAMLWVGPVLVHRFSPRLMVLAGTGLTFLAFVGFSQMKGDLATYYAIWCVYMLGYIFSGPIPHQILISQWFRRERGKAMGIAYVGVGLVASLGSILASTLTSSLGGFQPALFAVGALILLAWPVAIFVTKDSPSLLGQNPDGAALVADEVKQAPRPFGDLLRHPAFWLLLVGSACSIGAIGSVNQHMKLVFKDQGFANQAELDATWTRASVLILWSSIAGRIFMGWLADRFAKKYVMTATYALVALTIPLMLLVRPGSPAALYGFALLFGFGMGADYMLIPLMAAEQFGVNSLARAMAIILPTDTIGQTWFPWFVAKLRQWYGTYDTAMLAVFGMALVGAVAIALLPRGGGKDREDRVPGAVGAGAK
jgi:MFS family permease